MIWLVDGAHQKTTPNRYHDGYKPYIIKPVEAVIIHYTGSRRPTGTMSWLMNPKAKVSSHFLLERDGELWQLAPLSDRCWHAGGDSSQLFGERNTNGRTVGIEVMNVGPIVPDGDAGWRTVTGHEFEGAGISAQHKDDRWPYVAWEAYPPAQVDALVALLRKLREEFPILAHGMRNLGHEDVDPSRKSDPGPAFPWQQVNTLLDAA